MKQFLRFYAWDVEVKLYMSIYTAAVVFFQGITEVLQGRYTISVWVLLEMLLVSFVFAAIQYAVLPAGQWSSKGRLALWAVCANVLYIGGDRLHSAQGEADFGNPNTPPRLVSGAGCCHFTMRTG